MHYLFTYLTLLGRFCSSPLWDPSSTSHQFNCYDEAVCNEAVCDEAVYVEAVCDEAVCDEAVYVEAVCDEAVCDEALGYVMRSCGGQHEVVMEFCSGCC